MYSLIIPVYKNEESIRDLIEAVVWLNTSLNNKLETVFVVDGSPDNSYLLLCEQLKKTKIKYQLVLLSKNFGSFAAIRAGLEVSEGDYFAVMAADLQEPKELIITFFNELSKNESDILIGAREARQDPFFTKLSSNLFWFCYRKFVQPDMPKGGVDIFACNRQFRDKLLKLKESHSSLVGLIFWIGFRKKVIYYSRLERMHGQSAWTLKKKIKYMADSIFAFSDLPIKVLIWLGVFGLITSLILTALIFAAKFFGYIGVPGYAATVLIIIYFGSLNTLGLGIIGTYVWRAFENTKCRPESIIQSIDRGEM